MKEHISAVQPRTLPKPQGFSYGYEVKHGRLIFIAGQVARDGNNQVVGKGDIVAQFRQVCANLKAVLLARGGQMNDIVKLNIYVLSKAEYKARAKEIGAVY
ncbi:MAG TPA: RidA family protein, partial [Methylomirabilota bacterium]|nr:RidA family protein [Methylomirabilota bacterium]